MATISAAEFATELGTDSKTARRFLRTETPRDQQPGKGRQWAIEKRDVRSLKSRFAKWQAAEEAKKAERKAKAAEQETAHVEADTDEAMASEEEAALESVPSDDLDALADELTDAEIDGHLS